jgi:hypothetical protein
MTGTPAANAMAAQTLAADRERACIRLCMVVLIQGYIVRVPAGP